MKFHLRCDWSTGKIEKFGLLTTYSFLHLTRKVSLKIEIVSLPTPFQKSTDLPVCGQVSLRAPISLPILPGLKCQISMQKEF